MKAHLVTLGCPKNLVDSEAAVWLLRGADCTTTDDPADADLLIVNACSFLESSWQETLDEVERLSRYKNEGEKKLILMGCLPRHRGEDLEAVLPSVDHFLSTGAHGALPELVDKWRRGASGVPRRVDGADRFAGFEGRDLLTPAHTAYVKVAEGCNRKCSFCAIPVIRGRQETRPIESIVREVERLVARGAREISLLAQDIVAYSDRGSKFPDLVAAVAATGVDWIRIYYFHPAGIDAEYLRGVFAHPSVVRYLEMPVQHASDALLARMRRSHGRAHLERLLGDLRRDLPDLVIRSEVIVGFPGEGQGEFDELKGFVEEMQFDSLGIFPYSREPGTEAADMDGAVPPDVVHARAEELTSLQEAVSFGARTRFVGTTQRVLIDRVVEVEEGVFDACDYAGRFYGQAPEVDGEVFLAARGAAGEGGGPGVGDFVEVEIVDAGPYDLKGRM